MINQISVSLNSVLSAFNVNLRGLINDNVWLFLILILIILNDLWSVNLRLSTYFGANCRGWRFSYDRLIKLIFISTLCSILNMEILVWLILDSLRRRSNKFFWLWILIWFLFFTTRLSAVIQTTSFGCSCFSHPSSIIFKDYWVIILPERRSITVKGLRFFRSRSAELMICIIALIRRIKVLLCSRLSFLYVWLPSFIS